MYNKMSSANNDIELLLDLEGMLHILCLIAWANSSIEIANSMCDSGHPCQGPRSMGNGCKYKPLVKTIAVGLQTEYLPSQ